jgi:hypothetical protein
MTTAYILIAIKLEGALISSPAHGEYAGKPPERRHAHSPAPIALSPRGTPARHHA